MTLNGETRITGLIGDPVAHSRSPAILNTAYQEAGLNWVYVAFPVPARPRRRRGAAAAALGLGGPHRDDATQGRRRSARATSSRPTRTRSVSST